MLDNKLGAQMPRDVLLNVVMNRIHACRALIDAAIGNLPAPPPTLISKSAPFASANALPSPQPLPTDPCTLEKSRNGGTLETALRQDYEILGFCVQWAGIQGFTSPSPVSTPTVPPLLFGPTPVPPPRTQDHVWRKAVYVLALAADAPTSAQIVFQTTERLNEYLLGTDQVADRDQGKLSSTQQDPFSQFSVRYQLVPAPTWTLAQFQQQCFNDPSTAGAVVALQPSVASASWNWIFQGSYTKVEWSMMTIDCVPTSTSYLNNSALIKWASSRPKSSQGTRVSLSLSTALAVVAGFLAWHPSRSTTYDYASPIPSPLPLATFPASYTTTTYPNGWVALAAAGSAALTPLSSSYLGEGPGVDKQTAQAIANNLRSIITDMLAPCMEAQPNQLYLRYPQCRWFSPAHLYTPPQKEGD
ncbi:MAG TPA: hypothetical protein VMF11_06080 [Candidatus Baltobacteraceae bacterium]|nr:hypothetical protein [Candidatus Baltobacteraceae bacterium]